MKSLLAWLRRPSADAVTGAKLLTAISGVDTLCPWIRCRVPKAFHLAKIDLQVFSNNREKAMTRTCTILIVGIILLALPNALLAADQQAPVHKPNIIFILADDLGLDGVGCYGSDRYKRQTPHIDALAHTGVRFLHGGRTPCPGKSF